MNPILALPLTIFVVSNFLFTVYGVTRIIVMINTVFESEEDVPFDEIEQMVNKHWLVSALFPIACWWMYPFRFIRSFIRRAK